MEEEKTPQETKDAVEENKIETETEVVESDEEKARRRQEAEERKNEMIEQAEKYSETGGRYGYKAAAELWEEINRRFEGYSQAHNEAWRKYGKYLVYNELANIKNAVGKIEFSQIDEIYQEAIKAFSKSYSVEDKDIAKRIEAEYNENKKSGNFESWVEAAKFRQEERDLKKSQE